jgi:sirohydrochlorin ferrochelatase
MTTESIILIGRDAGNARELFETHADRLRTRGAADSVTVATYDSEPVQELREQFRRGSADRFFAVPMDLAHSHETVTGIPRALSYLPGEVTYCEPVGQSPAVTDVIEARASEQMDPSGDSSLVLIGFGSSSKPYYRQMAEYHAARLREQTDYGEVLDCYLLQNPTVECVRYNLTNPAAVAVPLFVSQTEATRERIPAKLELDRGGVEYATVLGDHPRITDALHAEIEKQRTLLSRATQPDSFEAQLARSQRPVATDGDGSYDS